ncbi:MAG: PEP-utilizing enzyme [Nanoarchaeota archaeon]
MIDQEDLTNVEWRFSWNGSCPYFIIHPLFLRPIRNWVSKFRHIPYYVFVSDFFGKELKARFPDSVDDSKFRDFFNEEIGDYFRDYEKLIDETRNRLEYYKYLSKKESRRVIVDEWESLGDLLERNLTFYLYTQPECLDHLGEDLMKLLKFYYSNEKAHKLLDQIIYPQDTIISQRDRDLLRLKRMSLSKEFEQELFEHHWKFRSYYMVSLNGSVDEEINQLKKSLEKINNESRSFVETSKLPLEIEKLSKKMRDIGTLRFKAKNIWMNLFLTINNLFDQISKQIGIQRDELEKWTHDEILYFLENNSKPTGHELKEIKKCVIAIDEKGINILQPHERLVEGILFNREKEIKGKSAYPGLVSGTAFVLDINDDYSKKIREFEQANNPILVIGQTTPREMIFIRNSVGIITDEGGILSHAAIVAREYRIPTLIGTNHGTTFFKNGEKIVLDCDNGLAYHEEKL